MKRHFSTKIPCICSANGIYTQNVPFSCWTLLFSRHMLSLSCEHMMPDLNLMIWNSRAHLWPSHVILPRVRAVFCVQNDIYEWARDHRVHHKYSETDADPHNATRGFFFAHIGWLLVRKHPDVIEKGKKLELSDLKADKVVMFQRRWAEYFLVK